MPHQIDLPLPFPEFTGDQPPLPVRMLNEFVYCPRLFHLMHVEGRWACTLLGGDNGLRGYPLRYQSGTRRALFTVEERFYTDLYVWQLFRIGGAAFFDVGRAWGGENVNTVNPGWLSNAGVGMRIVSARAAFSSAI